MPDKRNAPVQHGRCFDCGDEWSERGYIVVCPECHSTNVVEVGRKYAMTRLAKGDYLLPSNDAKTLWRIYTYEEEGSLVHVMPDRSERAVVGTFWALAKRPMPSMQDIDIDVAEWDGWEFWAGPLNSRRAAIDEAMRS